MQKDAYGSSDDEKLGAKREKQEENGQNGSERQAEKPLCGPL
jgi:hypothetical protein